MPVGEDRKEELKEDAWMPVFSSKKGIVTSSERFQEKKKMEENKND